MHAYDQDDDAESMQADGESAKHQTENRHPLDSNAYPDPEDVPSYPWISSRAVEHGSHIANSPIARSNRPWASASSDDDYDGQNDSLWGDKNALLQAQINENDPTVDPDFQFSDNSPTYALPVVARIPYRRLIIYRSDDLLSEAESEPKPLGVKRRGRPPGKAGVRSPTQRRSNARGRGGRKTARGGPGIKRGPRKPLEPNSEFKAVHSQATMAFIAHDYDEAEDLALEAINQNPEMFAAHSLLSEIHMARGDVDKATAALFNGAHTRPGDVKVWLRVADLLLERNIDENHSLIPDALYCLARVLNIEPNNVDMRSRRATLNLTLGYLGRAASEYEQMLKYLPHDLTVLRRLAHIYVELGDVDRAMRRYNESIVYYQQHEPHNVTTFSWSDLNVYAELFGYDEHYETGIQKLKALSRWLLGRGQDSMWESFSTDDREWDLEDERRLLVAGFKNTMYDPSTYGAGLPVELRIKLGLYRLRLGDSAEAMASITLLSFFEAC